MKKYCFFHIPKTGGISFREYLSGYYHSTELYDSYYNFSKAITKIKKWDGFIAGHFIYNPNIVKDNDLISITILREPIQRTISQILHIIRSNTHWLKRKISPFPDNIDSCLSNELICSHISNTQTKYLGTWNLYHNSQDSRQMYTISSQHFPTIYDGAVKAINSISHILFTEDFNKHSGISNTLKTLNKMPDDQSVEKAMISSKSIDKITMLNKFDIAIYEYAFSQYSINHVLNLMEQIEHGY